MKEKDIITKAVSMNMPDIESIKEICVNQTIMINKDKYQKCIWIKRLTPIVFILLFVFILVLSGGTINHRYNLIATTTEEIYIVPHWDDLSIEEKYGEIEYNNSRYTSAISEINNSEIVNLLGETTASGYDVYNDKEYTINCSVYSIKSIASNAVVAVKFDEYEGYYSYINNSYNPESLGNLIDDLNLHKNLGFNKIYYSYWKDGILENGNYIQMEYTLSDTSVIWDILLSDTSLKNEGDTYYGATKMGISIDVKNVGHKNISLAVNDAGYLQTNILNTGKTFFIGKDKVEYFIDYVLTNGTGTRIQRDSETADTTKNE
ncbi:hypothetical protein KHQ81_02640 [Mycoplasmatota bacterium]|nr:hypothetical protein KHQ81_02640 [Mycoplasmatota bacterium]